MCVISKPHHIYFGSGPTRKIPGWTAENLAHEALGSSHRGTAGLALLQETQALLRSVLRIPTSHEIAFVSGGGTGAMECLLWNLLGRLPVRVFSAGVFGQHWLRDTQEILKVPNVTAVTAPFAQGPDFQQYDPDEDAVFVWTETTTGTRIPHSDWIAEDRTGLTICDATCAVFTTEIQWEKCDALAFSWQKGLGAEAGLGTIVLSPRAIERLETYTPDWPIPRIFRIPKVAEGTRKKIPQTFFEAHTINTVSLLTVRDMQLALEWAQNAGGLDYLIQQTDQNFSILSEWINRSPHVDFMVKDEKIRARTPVCISLRNLPPNEKEQWNLLRKLARFLEENHMALDILNHAESLPGLRVWTGPAISPDDLTTLCTCLDDALQQ